MIGRFVYDKNSGQQMTSFIILQTLLHGPPQAVRGYNFGSLSESGPVMFKRVFLYSYVTSKGKIYFQNVIKISDILN